MSLRLPAVGPENQAFPWPGGARFALFLSHDVDQIFDREMFRLLADVNHLRRVVAGREPGDARECLRRVHRSVFAPKDEARQFRRILDIEARHGWRSTFFFLEGARWSRYGSRYELEDRRVQTIAAMLADAGCELGVHGGWHDLDDAAGYRRSAERLFRSFGARPVGIRNHYLRFTGSATWRAQRDAGFEYDATFGTPDYLGHREGRTHPFGAPIEPSPDGTEFFVLPLTIMDTTLFRHLGLRREVALERALETARATAQAGGLLTLLWHNNYFDEPEFEDWEDVYRRLLAAIADWRPWCAVGAKIARFCRESGARVPLAGNRGSDG